MRLKRDCPRAMFAQDERDTMFSDDEGIHVSEAESNDLDPVYCHRCGDYCSEPRVKIGEEWLCPACTGPVCHACGERSPDCIDRDDVPVCPSCAEQGEDYTGPVCMKCRKPTSEHVACYIMGKWLCDGCAAAKEREGDRKKEEK